MASRAPGREFGRVVREIRDERRSLSRAFYARHQGMRRLRLVLVTSPGIAVVAFVATVTASPSADPLTRYIAGFVFLFVVSLFLVLGFAVLGWRRWRESRDPTEALIAVAIGPMPAGVWLESSCVQRLASGLPGSPWCGWTIDYWNLLMVWVLGISIGGSVLFRLVLIRKRLRSEPTVPGAPPSG